MKTLTKYIAAALVGASVLLPNYACGKSGLNKKKHHEPSVVGLKDISSSIDELLDNADPNKNNQIIELIISEDVVNNTNVQATEGLAAWDIGKRLQTEIQQRYNTSRVMVTARFANAVANAPYEQNRIYVGTPGTNKLIADTLAALPDQHDANLPFPSTTSGIGRVYGVSISNGKFVILVTARDSVDVLLAGYALSEYDNYINGRLMDFHGQIVNVTNLPSDPITTVVK